MIVSSDGSPYVLAMITSTVENYLKRIYLEQQADPAALVPMGKLAAVMQVVPGTATAMVKTLADSGLLEYEPRGGIRLTPGGEQLALHVLRRHRIIELFLVETLGLDWSEVHAEAETLEHAVSDKVLERMDRLLKHPRFDPHGDPIPPAKGRMPTESLKPLTSLQPGQRAHIARVADQDPAFLQFIERSGLLPGTALQLRAHDHQADAYSLKILPKGRVTLGGNAACKIMVRDAGTGS